MRKPVDGPLAVGGDFLALTARLQGRMTERDRTRGQLHVGVRVAERIAQALA